MAFTPEQMKKWREENGIIHTRGQSAISRLRSRRAVRKGFEFNLDLDWYKAEFAKGCALTGIKFVYGTRQNNSMSPSVDRIDNAKGYVKSNCRLILNCINSFKGAMSDAEMIAVAKVLVDRE